MAGDDFFLEIDILNRETSKDSNSQRYIVKVENKQVEYKYSYSGFPDEADESTSRTLSDDELSEIIQYIKNQEINNSITESKSQDANGPSRKVNLSLILKLDGKTIESNVSGNYKIFRADGKIKGEIIKNIKYVDDVMTLIMDLKGLNY